MSGGSSEEKKLPPSQQKLRKAREKGQVVTSRESLASVSVAVVLLYLFTQRNAVSAEFQALFTLPTDPGIDFFEELARKGRESLDLGISIVLPILLGVIVVMVLGGMTISGGPVFSTQALSPDFNKLNPASGFKKIAGRRALMGFMMHVLRLIILMIVPGLILWGHMGVLVSAPPCGLSCSTEAIYGLITPLLMAILCLLILSALLDYMVQRAEFMHEQRMSLTEFKREMKEQDGDPLLKGQMKFDQRNMIERPTGLAQATILLRSGSDMIIGVRYVEGETPAPLVVIRGRGRDAIARIVKSAKSPVAEANKAVEMIEKIPVGEYIVEDDHIQEIAPYLRSAL